MENSLFQLGSISDYWMSLSSIVMAKDMIFGVMCGAGLFLLLIPFLKKNPASPPLGSRKNPPKVVRRGQSRTRKKNVSAKGGRHGRKNVEETQNASRAVETPIKQPLLDSTSLPIWNSNEKLDQPPLSQLLSYLKVLEDLIQRKCSQVFWGMPSVLSESVVASAWVSKRSSSAGPKTVRFSDACSPFPALPMTQEPPQIPQAQPLPHQPVTPSLTGVKEAHTLGSLPSSTLNRSRSRVCEKYYSTSETKIPVSLPIENQDLEWKDTLDSSAPKQQVGISWPTHNLPNDTLPAEPVRSASILPEHCQFLQHHKGTQSEDKVTEVREIRGSPFKVLSSPELTQLWGHFPANSPRQPKNKPGLPQPTQPSILDSKICKLSQTIGSVSSATPLKKSETCDMHDPIKKGPSLSANDFPCTSSSSPGKGLEPRKPALRTDQQSYVNTVQDLSFLDPKTQMKLESNITQLPMKCRKRPYLQILESGDLTPLGIPTSFLPQPVYPSSPTSVSKAEYYSKAAMILEKLHHRDPGGTRVETVSTARLRSPLLAHSPSQVQVIQRAPPPAASHGPSKALPHTWKSYLSTKTQAFCFQTRTQQSRTIREIGRSSLQPRTSPRMYKPAAGMKFENMVSGHPCWSGTMLDPQERIPPSVVKQINRSKEKEGTSPAWKVSLGSTEIPCGQVTNIHLRDFESPEANRSPGHFQTPTPRYSRDSALKTQVYSETDFRSSKQPQSWSVGHHPDSSSSVSLPSEHLFPSFQNRTKKPKTSQSLGDVFVRRDHSQRTQDFRVPRDKIQAKNHKVFHPNKERKEFMRSRALSQEEQAGRGTPSTPSSTWFKDTATTKTEPSLDMPGIEQTPQESYVIKIIRNIMQYISLSTKDQEQEDSLKKESSPPSSTMTQEKLIYRTATEVQSLMNIVVQLLVNWLGLKKGHPSEAQWCKVESLIPQLRDSCFHFPEGIYEPKKISRPEKISSGPHTSPMAQSHTFRNKVIGDKHQSGIATQETCVPHQNSVKRGMGCEQLPSPKGNNHPCRHRETRQAAVRCWFPENLQLRSNQNQEWKALLSTYQPQGHNHVFMHRDVGGKPPSGVVHRACDPHQSTKKGMGCGPLTSSKENNHPVTYRGTGDKEQSPQTDLTSVGLGAGASGHHGLCAS